MLNEVAVLNLALSESIISVCHISSFVIKLFVFSQISPIYAAMFFPFKSFFSLQSRVSFLFIGEGGFCELWIIGLLVN